MHAPASPMQALICLTLLHALVDACAILVAPLWGELNDTHNFGRTGLKLILTVHALSPSVSQVVFGYIRDRRALPGLLWTGPAIAAICVCLVAVAPNVLTLAALLVCSGICIGAFHPEAAVTAGNLLPEQRTRGLSLFLFGGALGLGTGPVICGGVVALFGARGLLLLVPPMVLLALALYRMGGFAPRQRAVTVQRLSISEMLDGRIGLAAMILAVCSLRLVPNMAMDKVLSFKLSGEGESPLAIGLVQSVFLISASAGMLVMASRFRSGWEKTFMILCPLISIPILWGLGMDGLPRWALVTLLVPAGVVLWGTGSVMVSYAHQQFPRGAGLASALTMGLAWGVGGLIQAEFTSRFQTAGRVETVFWACIPCLLLSSLGALCLPGTGVAKPERDDSRISHEAQSAAADVGMRPQEDSLPA